MTIEALEKELKEKRINSIYLFYGEEQFLLQTMVKKIKNLFGELLSGINYIQIDETNVEQLISDIQTPAFGYEKKLILVKNSGLLKKEGKRKNQKLVDLKSKVNEYISENIQQIQETTILVFIEEEIEKNALYKTIENIGIVCPFETLKPPQVMKRMKGICNAYKVEIDDNVLKYFVEVCGTNMQDLINEIRKLIEFAGENGTITKQAVDLLCIKQINSIIFDLTDNLGKKNVKKAIEVLHNLLYTKEPIQKILITLYYHFKKLYIVKLSEKYNKSLTESLNLKPNQMFLTNKYKAQATYFKQEELKKILEELMDLDFNYKTGKIDLNIGLEAILCRYCS